MGRGQMGPGMMAGGTCQVVEGSINPMGWCVLYQPISASNTRGEPRPADDPRKRCCGPRHLRNDRAVSTDSEAAGKDRAALLHAG